MKIKLLTALMIDGTHRAAETLVDVSKSLAEELVYLKRATLDLEQEPAEKPKKKTAK